MFELQKHERIVINNTHLMIYKVNLSDAGRYSCVIINDLGKAIGTAWITVTSQSTSTSTTLYIVYLNSSTLCSEPLSSFTAL